MSAFARSSDADPGAEAAKPAAAMTDPAIAGRYRVIETLASGAEDAAYLCRRLDTGDLVELRVLSGRLGGDRLVGAAIRQQATVVARIANQCPGIAMVHECERAANGELVLVMAHPDGPSLRDVLRRDGTLSTSRALELAIQIAQTLERGHGFGLVHGGLRPENVILVNGEAEIVLTHMGFDWLLQSRSAAGEAGARPTPSAYQAPEQAAGEAGQQSDVYAVGAILYEMLAGAPPSTGAVHRRLNPEPLARLRPDVGPSLERIVMRALDVDPARRQADISTMCNDLWIEAGPSSPAPSAARRSPASEEVGRRARQLAALFGLAAIGAVAIWFGHARMTSWTGPPAKSAPSAAATVTPSPPPPARAHEPGRPSPARPGVAGEPGGTASTLVATPPPGSQPAATRRSTSEPVPPSLTAPGRPLGTSSPPAGPPPSPRPPLATSPRPPEPLDRGSQPARSAEPAPWNQDSAPVLPPKPAAQRPVVTPSPVASPPAAAPPAPRAATAPPAVAPPAPVATPPPAAAAPPPAATPPARRNTAEDPGAIIDWLISGGSTRR